MSQTPNWKLPLGLAIALALLWGVASYVQFVQKPKDEKAEQATKKVFPIDEQAIKSITLHDGVIGYTFECQDLESDLCKPGDQSEWTITAPKTFKADKGTINSLVTTLKNLRHQDTVDLSADTEEKRKQLLTDYELAPESLKVTTKRRVEIELADSDKITLYLGGEHSIGDKIFAVRKTGDEIDLETVYLLSSFFKSNLDYDLDHWRNKSLFDFKATDVVSFKMSGSAGSVRGERKEGSWILNSGAMRDVPGDDEAVTNWTSALGFLKAKSFARATKGKKVLSVDLTLRGEKSKPQKADFFYHDGGKEKELYVKVAGSTDIYLVPGASKDRIVKGLKDLRLSKLLSSVERFTAKMLKFSGGSLTRELGVEKKDGKWRYLSSEMGKKVDEKKIRALLEKVSGKKIENFLSKAPAGEAKGLTFRLLTDKEEAKERELRIWKRAGKVYARDLSSGRKEVFEMNPAIWPVLPSSDNFFEEAKKPEKKKTEKAEKESPAKAGTTEGASLTLPIEVSQA